MTLVLAASAFVEHVIEGTSIAYNPLSTQFKI